MKNARKGVFHFAAGSRAELCGRDEKTLSLS
jgi:hypothetical protein